MRTDKRADRVNIIALRFLPRAFQDRIQRPDASFVLGTDSPLPPNVDVPGDIRYSDGTVGHIILPSNSTAHRTLYVRLKLGIMSGGA